MKKRGTGCKALLCVLVLLLSALPEGEYSITLSIKGPAENGYLLHVDSETGVEADEFWAEPLEATWTGWKFVKEW